jgi:hypothetical protein
MGHIEYSKNTCCPYESRPRHPNEPDPLPLLAAPAPEKPPTSIRLGTRVRYATFDFNGSIAVGRARNFPNLNWPAVIAFGCAVAAPRVNNTTLHSSVARFLSRYTDTRAPGTLKSKSKKARTRVRERERERD